MIESSKTCRVIPIAKAQQAPLFGSTVANGPAIVGDKVEIQLFTTLKCNISCSYCVMDVGDALGSQGKASYSVDDLERFVDTQLEGKEVYFTFFGGEPLLNRKFIQAVMDRFPDSKFQLQTNGTLLSKTPPEMIERFSNFLISVDGGQQLTDKYRGKGVHARVMANVESIRSRAKGSLTARMTWCDPETSLEDFSGLIAGFDQVHFQFAQQKGVYEPEHVAAKKRVCDELVEAFYAHPGIYPVVPLMGIARNLARPDLAVAQCFGSTHCRVSTNLINVRPDGRVFGCPDMTWEPTMEHGSVPGNTLARSPLQMTPRMPCYECSAKDWCRGNCMKNLWVAYELNDRVYREQVVEPVCSLVRHLGERIAAGNPASWLAKLSEADQTRAISSPIYDFTEIIP